MTAKESNRIARIEKKFYRSAILELIDKCDDVSLLDLVYQMLCKSILGRVTR